MRTTNPPAIPDPNNENDDPENPTLYFQTREPHFDALLTDMYTSLPVEKRKRINSTLQDGTALTFQITLRGTLIESTHPQHPGIRLLGGHSGGVDGIPGYFGNLVVSSLGHAGENSRERTGEVGGFIKGSVLDTLGGRRTKSLEDDNTQRSGNEDDRRNSLPPCFPLNNSLLPSPTDRERRINWEDKEAELQAIRDGYFANWKAERGGNDVESMVFAIFFCVIVRLTGGVGLIFLAVLWIWYVLLAVGVRFSVGE